jgi:PAS domain S-box-containing protein
LHVPPVFDNDLIGVLAIGSTDENAYGDREIEIAESVSRQMAGAIANLQLSQQREFALSALGERESLFRALLQYAPNGIVVSDSKGRILLVNEQTESLFGYDAGELEGQKVDVLIPSRLKEGHPGHREDYMVAPTSRTMGSALDLVALRKDGTEVPVDISLGPLETSDGTLVISSIRDMTETRQAEMAIRASEAELSDLFENAPLGYHELDAQGRVTRVNTTLLEMLGLSPEEIVGCSIIDFVIEDSRSGSVDALKSALQALPGALSTSSRTMVRKDGTPLPITADYRQIRDETGKVTGLRVSSRDVTDIKRLEGQLLHAQKMEAVGQLAGGVAHDFNNILTAVMAHASLAKKGLSSADNVIVEDIDGILKAANRAAELTRQLLTFSRQDVARPKPI